MTAKNNFIQQTARTIYINRFCQIITAACLVIALAFVAGCKKDNNGATGPTGEYYIKFKANGSLHVIDYAITQGAGIVDSSLTIGGKKVYTYTCGAANANAEFAAVGFYSETRLTAPRTFNESTTFKNTVPEAILQYAPDAQSLLSGQIHTSIGTVAPNPALYPEYASFTRDGIVSISEYTSTYIAGTFSGSIYQLDGTGDINTSKKLAITEGEFKLKLP